MSQRPDFFVTGNRRTWSQHTLGMLAAAALCASMGVAQAKGTPEQQCQKGRYEAAATYTRCQQKVLGRYFGGSLSGSEFEAAVSQCRVRYTNTWAKLQKKAGGTGSTCDNPRFDDHGDGTVTDRLTALQWEKKTDDATVHDKDNVYTWSTAGDGNPTDADGSAFTSFFAALNSGGCFAGHCDWRLPTIYELQTILLEPYPCTTSPCIDQAVFGPAVPILYWSDTSKATAPSEAWGVYHLFGDIGSQFKVNMNAVRAVRTGS
jgi:hypothetical protein